MPKRELSCLEGEIVRHFKGDLYLVLAIAENTETKEKLVVYKALYGDGKVWARPYDMFGETVPEGKPNPTGQLYRFELYEPQRTSDYEEGD